MQIKNVLKKILIAGATAGSAAVIAACYGVYYGPHRTVSGPVMHVGKPDRGPTLCVRRPGTTQPECTTADQLPSADRKHLQNAVTPLPTGQSDPLAAAK